MKLTKKEKAAQAACVKIKADNFPTSLTVVWVRSAAWGRNPSVMYRGEKIGHASGCGYDKESACLAEALRFLGETPEQTSAIWQCGGAGVRELQRVLHLQGWKLEQVFSGKWEDGYTIGKIAHD